MEIGALVTEKQHSEHAEHTRLLYTFAVAPQTQSLEDHGGVWDAQGTEGGPQEQARLRIRTYSPQGCLYFWALKRRFDH